jgi:F-type H+-transporting ATPase subunit gamma
MVSAARLRRAQERVIAARPYARKMREVFVHVAEQKTNFDDPLFKVHDGGNRVCYVVITSDRGQCGAYNANVLRKAMTHADKLNAEWRKEHPDGPELEISFITAGRKGRDFLAFRHYLILREFLSSGDMAVLELTRRITDDSTKRFIRGEVDQVYLVYSEFVSVMTQKPIVTKLLPLEVPKLEEEGGGKKQDEDKKQETVGAEPWVPDYEMEPSAEVIFAKLIPKYIETLILQALLEGRAGEYGARMTAMDNATKNAEEMMSSLTLSYNRARQAGITQELSEIVAGAEALK